MKIKVYTEQGYKIVNVQVQDDVKSISRNIRLGSMYYSHNIKNVINFSRDLKLIEAY